MMKKMQLLLVVLVALFFSSVHRVEAACGPAEVGQIQGQTFCTDGKFLCTLDDPNRDYCCDRPRECVPPEDPAPNPDATPEVGSGDKENLTDECVGPNAELATGCFLLGIDPLNPDVAGSDVLGGFPQKIRWIAFQTPGGVLNFLIPFLFVFAGLILFVMIVWGGFEMLMGAADTKSQESGKHRITAALTGFVLLFISYWIAQIVQMISGVNVLG